MIRHEVNNLQTRLVQLKDQKKAKNLHRVRIELFINENTERPKTYTKLNLLHISETTNKIY